MPGKVGVKIKAGRNLPVMDRGSDTTDAYVEIKLGNTTYKTEVCRKSLNPQWNTDWYRFEVDDADLQDEPLQIRLMDHDTYSANDAIGKVNISLNPLCLETAAQANQGKGAVMSGWIPVFDTMHGIRGEVNVIVKVDLFSDANKFRQSSCGVQFFHSTCIPFGYIVSIIHGFVEELVCNDDPEYQWIDKIRTPRASNEARQVVFLKLSGQVQRKMGLKAINLGANAVIGYTQCFDLEGDSGVVARGIGTAVTLVKIQEATLAQPVDNALIEERTIKYLEFLKCTSIGENKFDDYSPNKGDDIIYKILGIDPLDRTSTCAPNIILKKQHWRPPLGKNTIIEENFEENETMRNVLEQEDQRGEPTEKKMRHHVKRLKSSSKNLLNEKFNMFKSSNNEQIVKGNKKFDTRSLSGSFSDLSITDSTKSSLNDLRNLMFFRKNRKQQKYNRSVSDGSSMATLLVSSILRGPSLDSISEVAQDHSPNRSKTKESSKSESMSNLLSSAKVDEKKPTVIFEKCKKRNIKAETLNEIKGFPKSKQDISVSSMSVSSAPDSSSSSTTSTTEEECISEENSEESAISPKDILVVDPETVSMVIKTVLSKENNDEDENQWIKPGSTSISSDYIENFARSNQPIDTKIMTGGTKILQVDKHQKILESKIVEKETTAAQFNLMVKRPSIDIDEDTWIEPGSTVDEPETIAGEKHHSLLHNFTKKLHHLQEHMHLPHFSEDKGRIIHKHGLLDTAMETMLLEKANILGTDINLNIQETSDEQQWNQEYSKIKENKKHVASEIKDESGLLGTAMKTMLMETLNLSEDIGHNSKSKDNENLKITSDINHPRNNKNYNKQSQNANFSNSINQINKFTSKGFQAIDVPIIALTYKTHPPKFRIADNNKIIKKSNSFYSSEPVVVHPNINFLPSLKLNIKPFLSLTNLNVFADSIENQNNFTVSKVFNSTSSLNFYNCTKKKMFVSCAKPRAIIIHPSTPLASPDSPLSPKNIFNLNYDNFVKKCKTLSNNNDNLNNANCSYLTNTNQMQMLTTQFPSCIKQQLRSTTELVASGSSNVGPSTSKDVNYGASTSASCSTTKNETLAQSGNVKASDLSYHSKHNRAESIGSKVLSPAKADHTSNSKNNEPFRRSSDSDLNMATPKGNSICVASERLVAATTMMRLNGPISAKSNTENIDMLEYPFLTIDKFPPGFILHLGAAVCARSVKLLEKISNPNEPELRDFWWTELRMEIRSHARALGCNVILGYSEVTTIADDVCVLSALGTAAIINMAYNNETQYDQNIVNQPTKKDVMVSSLDERECLRNKENEPVKDFSSSFGGTTKNQAVSMSNLNRGCGMCHASYNVQNHAFSTKLFKCTLCKRGKVPNVILSTIELPENLQITGHGCFIQAQVVRVKKDLRAESNAKDISDGLPFLEYELNRVLMNKLKAKGMNAIFGLKAHVAIGERLIAFIATGTAVYLSALPPPDLPKLVAGNTWTDTARLNELQKSLQEAIERNKEIYQLKCMDPDAQQIKQHSDTDDSEDELLELDLNAGNKDSCVLEVDDIEDLEIISLLMEQSPPEGFHVVNTHSVPGLHDMEVVKNLQMFTQIWRAKIAIGSNMNVFPKHFQRLLQTIFFKLRTMIPCAICNLKFRLDLPESDEIQILVTGMALGLGEVSKVQQKLKAKPDTNDSVGACKKALEEEMIFTLDEDHNNEVFNNLNNNQQAASSSNFNNLNYGSHSLRVKRNSPSRPKYSSVRYSRHLPLHDRYGVDITPLCYIPCGRIDKYLGNLNFFFIRETTSIREIGGISGFVHSFITEILGIVRSHITALSGNAMVSFYMTELLLVDNQNKNQGQCLISVGGDVVSVSYFGDD